MRRVTRINYDYLDKLFAALDKVGIDPRELPREFARMAWEGKMELLKSRYNVSICARCKLPRPEAEMDVRYSLCKQCASTLHHKSTRDPRVMEMLRNHLTAQDEATLAPSSIEMLRKLETETPPVESNVNDILDRAAKRPTNGT